MAGAWAWARARATDQYPAARSLGDAKRPPINHRAAAHRGQATRLSDGTQGCYWNRLAYKYVPGEFRPRLQVATPKVRSRARALPPRPAPPAASNITNVACKLLAPGDATSRYREGSSRRARTIRPIKPRPDRPLIALLAQFRTRDPVTRLPVPALEPAMRRQAEEIGNHCAAEAETKIEVKAVRNVESGWDVARSPRCHGSSQVRSPPRPGAISSRR